MVSDLRSVVGTVVSQMVLAGKWLEFPMVVDIPDPRSLCFYFIAFYVMSLLVGRTVGSLSTRCSGQ